MTAELEALKDENGQVSFAAAVYYAPDMSAEDKIFWLEQCADGEGENALSDEFRAEAQNYLDQICRSCGKHNCVGDYAHYEQPPVTAMDF